MRTIPATDEEIAALRQLLDLAVQKGGIGAAEAALHWTRKCLIAMQPKPTAPAIDMANKAIGGG